MTNAAAYNSFRLSVRRAGPKCDSISFYKKFNQAISDQSSRFKGLGLRGNPISRKLLLFHEVNKSCLGCSHAAVRRPSAFAQQPTFRTGTRTVALYATVTDAQKRLVPDLTEEDFQIFDNDKPQALELFINEVQPFTVVVMLDTSASMTGNLKLLEQAAEQFLLRMLPKDKGLVGAFNDKIEFFPATFTGDRDKLIRSLRDLDFGNPTRLYDAIAASMDRLHKVDGRRVVLVFTDGDDTGSRADGGSVLEQARREEVMIYAVGSAAITSTARARCGASPTRG